MMLIVLLVAALLEMGEDVGDELGVLDAGEDLEWTAAAPTGVDVDGEHAFEALHPGHRDVLGRGGRVVRGLRWSAAAAAGGGDVGAQAACGGEHAVESREVDARRRDEGGESSEEVERLEQNV